MQSNASENTQLRQLSNFKSSQALSQHWFHYRPHKLRGFLFVYFTPGAPWVPLVKESRRTPSDLSQ